MKKEKTKVYIYTRVSTAMQIDGYSLDAKKYSMKAFAEYNDFEIVGASAQMRLMRPPLCKQCRTLAAN